MNKVTFYKLLFIIIWIALTLSIQAQNINDCIIKYGIDDFGPFQPECLNSRIIGYAYISNVEVPDIFTYSNNDNFFYCEAHTRTPEGIPVYKSKRAISYRGKMNIKNYSDISIFQSKDRKVHLFYLSADNTLWHAEFDKTALTFINESSIPYPKSSNPVCLHAYFDKANNLKLINAIRTVSGANPPGNKREDPFHHYDGAGIWLGKNAEIGLYEISYQGMDSPGSSRLVTPSGKEILNNCSATTSIYYTEESEGDVIAGSRFGNLTYYKNMGGEATKFQTGLTIVDRSGNTLRNPAINAAPLAFPNSMGAVCDLMTAGEGGYYYFRFTGSFTENGNPIYEDPCPILYKNAEVHGGTLPVPTIVDWNKDGLLDIVVGSSEGFIYLYKNKGSNELPLFEAQERLMANGEIIHIQPGYYEDIQGVGESRWGYVGPNVVDWNEDGYWDILLNDARSRHSIFLGTADGLQDERPLYVNDLELRGTWRCRPGVGTLNGQMVYITLDDQDELHFYKRIDNYNLEDAGKLMMINGLPIIANNLQCGGTGRLRTEIVDWDGDGVKDLILSTCKNASVPNPINGFPWFQESAGKGATVLFLRNEGSEEFPVYAYPHQFSYGGKYINLVHHECGAATGMLGPVQGNLPNLLVFDELGRGFLLPRKNLSLSEVNISGVPVSINVNTEIKSISKGAALYSDQDIHLTDIHSGIVTNYFTQWNKSALPTSFTVKAKTNGNIYVATTEDIFPVSDDGKEWHKLTTASFSIDKDNIKFNIYTRSVVKDSLTKIPSVGTYGSILLSSDITFYCDEERALPGLLINEVNSLKGEYIPSSEIIKLSNGSYLGIYNVIKPEKQESFVIISEDKGKSWREVATMELADNPSIVEKAGVLFLIASDMNGNIVVRKSTNNGISWSKSTNSNNGIIISASGSITYQCCSSPAILFGNRLWKMIRVIDQYAPDKSVIQLISSSYYSSWDIASSWSMPLGSSLTYENSWMPGTNSWGDAALFLNNNQLKIVAGIRGSVEHRGALIDVDSENRTISFPVSGRIIDFPGGHNPFVIKTFPEKESYWTLSNSASVNLLNKLSLFQSFNMTEWTEQSSLFVNSMDEKIAYRTSGWTLDGESLISLLPISLESCLGGTQDINKPNKLIFIKYDNAFTSTYTERTSDEKYVIYSNPAKKWFVIDSGNRKESSITYTLCDIFGKTIKKDQLLLGEKKIVDLPKGIYFVVVNNQINKLIIQ